MSNIDQVLNRGVTNVIASKEALKKRIETGDRLNIYLGIDPTATHIHLGHAVPLRKINEFAQMGHHVFFLIGDFTALIGDTSDKDKERPVLTYEQIQENFQTYKQQAEKIVDFSKVKVVHNSDWLRPLKFEDIIKLCQHFSVGDFVGRELIRNRLESKQRVGLHETLYPVMQGYDSFHLDTDIQIGGADQTFNMQAGRSLLKELADKESFVLVTGYLEGTDGRKMSKSWGNAIWLDDTPDDMFGKVMSLRDELIITYFELATNASLAEILESESLLRKGENPINIKRRLAFQIVSELHSIDAAKNAEENFKKTFQDKKPEYSDSVTLKPGDTIANLASQFSGSISAAKRLIEQGGVDINEKKVEIHTQELYDGDKVRIGKKTYVTVKIEK